jgi:hypothetical protein
MADNAEMFTKIADMDETQKDNIRDAKAFFDSFTACSKERDMSKNAAMRQADREQELQRKRDITHRKTEVAEGGLVGREPGNGMLVGRRDLHPRAQQGTHLDLLGRGPNRLLRERVHRPALVPHPPQGSARPEIKGPAPIPIALGREPSALALDSR